MIFDIIQKLRALVKNFTDRNLIELLRLIDKKKKVLRLILNEDEVIPFKSCLNEMGLVVKMAPYMLKIKRKDKFSNYITTNIKWNNKLKKKFFLVYVSRSKTKCDFIINKEMSEDSDKNLGIYYGYPRCCVNNYSNVLRDKDWVTNLLKNTKNNINFYYNNKLAYMFNGAPSLIEDYFPCSLNCSRTLKLAKENYNLLIKYGFLKMTKDIVQKLKKNIFIYNDSFYQIQESVVKKNFLLLQNDQVFIKNKNNNIIKSKSLIQKKFEIFKKNNQNYIFFKNNKCPLYLFK